MSQPILTLRGISKQFGSVAALADVDIDVLPGEVHAVLGENGAGKSTLMKVIYGLVRPDRGAMHLEGAPLRVASPLDARRAGIGMVHQEFALIDALSVAENLTFSVCPEIGWQWRRAEVVAAAQRVATALGLELGDLDVPVGTLSVGQRQRIEIVKALAGEIRILILDEPTAVLTPSEVAQLFTVLDRVRQAGTAVLFITHKLGEVMRIADRVTVMRRGRIVGQARRGELNEAGLAQLMVGAFDLAAPPAPPLRSETAQQLELARVSVSDGRGGLALADVSLAVHAGEVFGVAGVDGNGQDELFEVLAGVRPLASGTIVVGGVPIARIDPAAMSAAGVACVPPDRQRQGLVPAMSVVENALLNAVLLRRLSPGWLTDPHKQRGAAQAMIDQYAIAVPGLDAPARTLSGGNAQKLVVARALALEPRVLVAVNPTRGLDIAAAQAVYAAFEAALARGTAVLLVSTDLDEIVARAHRLAVLYRGRLSHTVERPFSSRRIGAMMAGSREAA
ncbi:MAG TPA: ABC transporter ATP-binding protein [Dongiaceae bacterium]|nr:ABC transporter ATP-binding protein [Dongiaceae bacterium]